MLKVLILNVRCEIILLLKRNARNKMNLRQIAKSLDFINMLVAYNSKVMRDCNLSMAQFEHEFLKGFLTCECQEGFYGVAFYESKSGKFEKLPVLYL